MLGAWGFAVVWRIKKTLGKRQGLKRWATAAPVDLPVLWYAPSIAPLDLTPLADALLQLEAGLQEADAHPRQELLRDGVIQRFEYSHELALKFIRRTLETVFGDQVDTMGYNDVLRTAFERGLIKDIERWFEYRAARNKTSHTYDAKIAAEVYRLAAPFLADARFLLLRLHDHAHPPAA